MRKGCLSDGWFKLPGLTWSSKRQKEQLYSVTPVMVGREVQSLLLTCSVGSELFLGKVSQTSQERGSKTCLFPSWCSFLLITPAFLLNPLAYVLRTNDALNQWFPCMAFGRFISSLMCTPSSWEGLSQPSLLLSLCCCTFLVIESSLLPVSWGFEFPTFMSLPYALAFLFNVTVECWHLGWSLIFGVKYGDSSNR